MKKRKINRFKNLELKIRELEEKIRKEECVAVKNLFIALQNDLIYGLNRSLEKAYGLSNTMETAAKIKNDNVYRRYNRIWLNNHLSVMEIISIRKYHSLDKLIEMCENTPSDDDTEMIQLEAYDIDDFLPQAV